MLPVQHSITANPTIGYSWRVAKWIGHAVAQQRNAPYESRSHPPGMAGVGDAFIFTFTAVKPGTAALTLEYVRPSEKGKPPEATFTVGIEVAGR